MKIAREAVLLFANGEQEIQQTFSANSPSEFDLRKLNEGQVVRVKGHSEALSADYYYFYVVGKKRKDLGIFYFIKTDYDKVAQSGILKLGTEWKLEKVRPEKQYFPVKEAIIAMSHLRSLSNWKEKDCWDLFETTVLDIMSSGLKQKAKEKARVSAGLIQLIPAAQTIGV